MTSCTAQRHGTVSAYKRHRCRCPQAVTAMRATWRARAGRYVRGHVRNRFGSYDPIIDAVAVERRAAGDRAVPLTRAERRAAIALVDQQGVSAAMVAERLGVTIRTVQRHRAARRVMAEAG